MIYDVIVLGAGASGLYFSAYLGSKSPKQSLLLLEKNTRPGLKLLASGSGQCNLTHEGPAYGLLSHYGPHKKFVNAAIRAHDNQAVIEAFDQMGLACWAREDGKVFPRSMRSKDVLKALLESIRKAPKVSVKLGEEVVAVSASKGHFQVTTQAGAYLGRRLVVATGGLSYPQLGASGIGYDVAKVFGHDLVPPRPALAAVYTADPNLSSLMGTVLEKARVQNDSTGVFYEGTLLFTHFGLSGPVIIDNSRYFEVGDTLRICFSKDASMTHFLSYVNAHGDKPLTFYLNQLDITDKIKNWTLMVLGIKGDQKLATLDKNLRKALLSHLTAFEVSISALSPYKEAMATAGGVSLAGVDAKTMASKHKEGLYFLGEVLEIVGDTGGYNLQWAFSSAVAAATHIMSKDEGKQ